MSSFLSFAKRLYYNFVKFFPNFNYFLKSCYIVNLKGVINRVIVGIAWQHP